VSKGKPLTEVLAAVYYDALQDANERRGILHNRWSHLTPEAQAAHMHAMHSVVELLGAFGVGIRQVGDSYQLHKLEKAPKSEPREVKINSTALGAPERTDETVMEAKIKGFTGIPCDQCGSVNTVRIGKCLQCQSCFHNGECG
jgi:hypothetical protein